jgi:DNA-directed RNA polymerase specialized sigma24 family protein
MAPDVQFPRFMNDRAAPTTFTTADRQFVLAIARRIVGDNDAPDVAQDALLRAYHHRDQFRGDSRYRSWLFKIATSVSLSYLRRQRRRITLAETNEEEAETLAADAMSPEELVSQSQEHLRRASPPLREGHDRRGRGQGAGHDRRDREDPRVSRPTTPARRRHGCSVAV